MAKHWKKCICFRAVLQETNCHMAAKLTEVVQRLINSSCIWDVKQGILCSTMVTCSTKQWYSSHIFSGNFLLRYSVSIDSITNDRDRKHN